LKVADVFTFAQYSVIYPLGPLYCRNSKTLKPRFVRALKWIFIHCDHDRDGTLSDTELNDFQVLLFPSHLNIKIVAHLSSEYYSLAPCRLACK